ncbi:MAG: ribulose-phosphate 3-epimerase [bacterium]
MPTIQVLPSLLAADMGRLEEACRQVEAAGADGLHVDIMDGHFVPNLSMGPDVVRMARRATNLPLSVHLMVTQPDFFAKPFLDAGADLLHIHVEANCDPVAVLKFIRESGRRAGIVLNPETPLQAIEACLPFADEVLFMTVHPGFGGQKFIPAALPKMAELRKKAPKLDIAVDGGINVETATACAAAGANVMLAGTSIIRAPDMAAEIKKMRDEAKAAFKG